MTIYTGTSNIFNSWKEYLGKAANLGSDVFKMLLTTNSYTPNQSTHTVLADVSNELSGNGYARQTLGNITFGLSGGNAKFDFDDPVFTASGGSLTARFWVIFNDTVGSPLKPLVAYGLLDNSPADVVVTDGNTLTFNVNASGLFVLS